MTIIGPGMTIIGPGITIIGPGMTIIGPGMTIIGPGITIICPGMTIMFYVELLTVLAGLDPAIHDAARTVRLRCRRYDAFRPTKFSLRR